jgi:glutamate dehydrogenase (NAD(P)+)
MKTQDCTGIVQGFGNVGSVTAYTLARRHGVRITGVSDHTAAYYDPAGLPLDAIERYVTEKGILAGFSTEALTDPIGMLSEQCDILVPAAVERVITAQNAGTLRCRILAEGANGPTTPDADVVIDQRGDIFVIPDILCNSGGVIVSYFEWVQDLQRLFWTEAEVNDRLERLLDQAFTQVQRRAKSANITNRTSAMAIGVAKVQAGKQLRGLFP